MVVDKVHAKKMHPCEYFSHNRSIYFIALRPQLLLFNIGPLASLWLSSGVDIRRQWLGVFSVCQAKISEAQVYGSGGFEMSLLLRSRVDGCLYSLIVVRKQNVG